MSENFKPQHISWSDWDKRGILRYVGLFGLSKLGTEGRCASFGYLSSWDTYVRVECGWCGFKNRYYKSHVFKRDWTASLNVITSLGSIFRITGGNLYDHLMSMKAFTLIIHMSFNNYEDSGYDLDLDVLIISYYLCVSYNGRSGLVGKSIHLRSIYLILEWCMARLVVKRGTKKTMRLEHVLKM